MEENKADQEVNEMPDDMTENKTMSEAVQPVADEAEPEVRETVEGDPSPEEKMAAADEAGRETASGSVEVKSDEQESAQTKKLKVEEVLGTAGAEVAFDLKDLFKGMFTDPVGTLREYAARKEHAASYIVAAILSVLTFLIIAIMGDNPLFNQTIGRGALVIFSLAAAVAIFVFKAVYAACITLWGKKYNPELTYLSALGVFCLLGIYDVLILLVFTLVTILSIYELSIAVLLFWIIVTAVSGIMAAWVLTDGKAASVVRVNLVIVFVFLVLAVLCLRGFILDICAGAFFAVINMLGGF